MGAHDSGISWAEQHDVELLRAMIHLILSNRAILCITPGLADVAGNGGDRINKKMQALLARLAALGPGSAGAGMVKEELAKIGPNRSPKRKVESGSGVKLEDTPVKKAAKKVKTETSPKTKAKAKGMESSPVKAEEEDELESEGC